ncbi:MAG: hypothetical protein ACREIQ_06185 [Nitrospiria bacterium]
MIDLTPAQKRQLIQLMRLDPRKHADIQAAIRRAPKSAGRLIGRALADFNGIPADLYNRFERTIVDLNQGKAAIAPKGYLTLFDSGRVKIQLYRRSQPRDDLTLCAKIRGQVFSSRRLAYWGGDFGYIAGVKGMWKIAAESRSHFTQFIEQIRGT